MLGLRQRACWGLVLGGVLAAIGCGAEAEPIDSIAQGIGGSVATTGGAGGSGGAGGATASVVLSQGAAYTGATDATISKSAPTTNFGSSDTCIVDAGSTERSCALRWTLTGVPPAATIVAAQVDLTVSSPSAASFGVYRVTRRWSEAGVTWNNVSSAVAWDLPGAKGTADRETVPFTSFPGGLGVQSFAIPVDIVQAWLADSSKNDGLMISNAVNTDGVILRSSESATVAEHPKLTVWFH
jgi:hypothetical protein